MSEKNRRKKDGEDRGKKAQRMRDKTPDAKQGVDKPNVKQKRSVGAYVGGRRAEAAKRGWETRRANQTGKRAA